MKKTTSSGKNTKAKKGAGSAEPKAAKKQKKSSKTLWYIVGAVVIIAIIVLALILLLKPFASKNVLATVYGEEITMQDIDKTWDNIPAQYKPVITKQEILDQMINEKILIHEATRQGIPADRDELNSRVDEIITNAAQSRQITVEELEQQLKLQNVSLDDVKKAYYLQLVINELVEKEVVGKVNISDEEIAQFYESNEAIFYTAANATVKHILVLINENRTNDEAFQTINSIAESVEEDNSNFCDLVVQYSEDKASATAEKCGEYKITENSNLVTEFKDAAFNQNVGQKSLVKTMYGYHLLWTVEKTEKTKLTLSDVTEYIRATLLNDKTAQAYDAYLAELKKGADIKPANPLIPLEEAQPPAEPGTTA